MASSKGVCSSAVRPLTRINPEVLWLICGHLYCKAGDIEQNEQVAAIICSDFTSDFPSVNSKC